jgi:hypothetical protein
LGPLSGLKLFCSPTWGWGGGGGVSRLTLSAHGELLCRRCSDVVCNHAVEA